MEKATFDLRALPPVEALRKFLDFLVKTFPANLSIDAINVKSNLSENAYVIPGGDVSTAAVRAKAILEDMQLRTAYISVRKIRTTLPDQHAHRRFTFEYETQDDIAATFAISCEEAGHFQKFVPDYAKIANSVFTFTRRAELIGANLPAAEREQLRYYERALSDLTAAVAKLGEVTTQQIERQATYLQEKSAQLDAQATARAEQQRKEYDAALAAVAADRASLVKEKADLDLRRSAAVRRALLTDMRKKIEEKFSISTETTERRGVIHTACLIAMTVGGTMMICGAAKLLLADKFDWRFTVMVWSGLVLGGSTLVYYLRWNNHWFSTLARDEFDSRKFNLDVIRASWVAEMILEWTEVKGKPFPSQLLSAFTQGLFHPTDWQSEDHHPADDLANAVASISKFTISKDGVDIERKEE